MTQSSEQTNLNLSNSFHFDGVTPETANETPVAKPNQLVQFWDNFPLRTKITTLLLTAAVIPSVMIVQGVSHISKTNAKV